jgi:hypothetical protein
MQKLTYVALIAIVGCGSIHVAVAQTKEDSNAVLATIVSVTASLENSVVVMASGIMNAPSSAVSSPFSAVESDALASTARGDASPALSEPVADLGTLTSGLAADAAHPPIQASAAMTADNPSASAPVAFGPHVAGGRTAAPASAAMESIRPAREARSSGVVPERRPVRKR